MRFLKIICSLLFLSAPVFAHAEEERWSWAWNNVPAEIALDFYQNLSGEVIVVPNGLLGKVKRQPLTLHTDHSLSRAAALKTIEEELKKQASLTLEHYELAEAWDMNQQLRWQADCVMSIRVPALATNEVATNAIQLSQARLPKVKELYESLVGTQVICQSEKIDLLASGRFITLNAGPQTKETARQLLEIALGVQTDIQVGPVKNGKSIWMDKREALRMKEAKTDK